MSEKSIVRRGYKRTRLGGKLLTGQMIDVAVHEGLVKPKSWILDLNEISEENLNVVMCRELPVILEPQVDFAPLKPFLHPGSLVTAGVSRGRAKAKLLNHTLQEHQKLILQQQDQLSLMTRQITELKEMILGLAKPTLSDVKPVAERPRGNDPVAISKLVLNSCKWLSASTVSSRAGLRNKNPFSTPNKWKKNRLIFAINYQGQDHYPEFALGMDGKPLSIMKDILAVFNGHKVPLAIALWFVSINSWLDGVAPKDVIGTQPEDVLEAAKMEVAPIEHG